MFEPKKVEQQLLPMYAEPVALVADEKPCPYCAERIKAAALKCRHCGEMLGAVTGSLAAPNILPQTVVNNIITNTVQGSHPYQKAIRSRFVAATLAFFLGGLGVHKFYIGRGGAGILYVLFSWTFIPMVVGAMEALCYASYRSDEEFTHRVCD
jgi:hypothetical protein